MRCTKAQRGLQLELDNEIDARQQRQLHEHLTACPACRAYRQQLGLVHARMSRLAEATEQTCVAAECVLPSSPHRAPRWAAGVIAAAATLAIAAIGWWSFGSGVPVSSEHLVSNVVESRRSEPPPAPSRPDVQVTFGPDVIAVPMESKNPNVTILWVYGNVQKLSADDAKNKSDTSPSS